MPGDGAQSVPTAGRLHLISFSLLSYFLVSDCQQLMGLAQANFIALYKAIFLHPVCYKGITATTSCFSNTHIYRAWSGAPKNSCLSDKKTPLMALYL